MSHYSDTEDVFDRLAAAKYASQADLSDEDSVFKPRTKAPVKPVDDDLAAIEAEVNGLDTARRAQLTADLQKYEALRTKAQARGVTADRIAKITKKINEIQSELGTSAASEQEIRNIERDLAALEHERTAITLKIDALHARLNKLRPNRSEYLNDPSMMGGSVVNGKFVEDPDSGEDDYEQMAKLMAERRRIAQSTGQYNTNQVRVLRRGPMETSDTDRNVGF